MHERFRLSRRRLLVFLLVPAAAIAFSLVWGEQQRDVTSQAALYSPGGSGEAGIPKGRYRHLRGGSTALRSTSGTQSVKALAAARSLGPQPQASTGCQAPCFTFGLVSGRVSAIAFDPVE